MHLVLILVALNMAVCLLAGKVATGAEQGAKMAFMPRAGERPSAVPGGTELGRAARLTPADDKP